MHLRKLARQPFDSFCDLWRGSSSRESIAEVLFELEQWTSVNRLVVSPTNGKVAPREKVHRSAITALATLHDTTSIAHKWAPECFIQWSNCFRESGIDVCRHYSHTCSDLDAMCYVCSIYMWIQSRDSHACRRRFDSVYYISTTEPHCSILSTSTKQNQKERKLLFQLSVGKGGK